MLRRACAAATSQTEDYSSANSFMVCGVDNAFSLDDFKSRFSIEVTSCGAAAAPPCEQPPQHAQPPSQVRAAARGWTDAARVARGAPAPQTRRR